MTRQRIWAVLITVGVVIQIALAVHLMSNTMEQNKPQVAPLPKALEKPPPLANEKKENGYRNALMNFKNVDTSDWTVEPEFFRILLDRPNKSLINFVGGGTVDDTVVNYLQRFPLSRLVLGESHITRASLVPIATMENLVELSFNGVNLNPEDIRQLIRLKHLQRLGLTHCNLSDQSVRYLSNFGVLDLAGNKGITDQGAKHLKNSDVYRLALRETSITDRGAMELSKCSHLRNLDLWGDAITDKSVPYFNRMKSLEILNLNHTSITDQGLKLLNPLLLKQLSIKQCKGITSAGIEEFKRRKPKCILYFDSSGEI
jgi:Leucine-rich repeat (LRR) protein